MKIEISKDDGHTTISPEVELLPTDPTMVRIVKVYNLIAAMCAVLESDEQCGAATLFLAACQKRMIASGVYTKLEAEAVLIDGFKKAFDFVDKHAHMRELTPTTAGENNASG
jgi:hypothetical protein